MHLEPEILVFDADFAAVVDADHTCPNNKKPNKKK